MDSLAEHKILGWKPFFPGFHSLDSNEMTENPTILMSGHMFEIYLHFGGF